MKSHFENIIKEINGKVQPEVLLNTPKRAANAFKILTSGYEKNLSELVNGALFETHVDEMVVVKDIEFYSLCEHHLLPFAGICHIGYLPNQKVLGLSKVARIIDMFAQRLQIQEQLTNDIANALLEATNAKGIGVIIEAKHFCMMMRGVKKQNSLMKSSVMLGEFKKSPSTRQEFLSLVRD